MNDKLYMKKRIYQEWRRFDLIEPSLAFDVNFGIFLGSILMSKSSNLDIIAKIEIDFAPRNEISEDFEYIQITLQISLTFFHQLEKETNNEFHIFK
jgi:hypothetical protein